MSSSRTRPITRFFPPSSIFRRLHGAHPSTSSTRSFLEYLVTRMISSDSGRDAFRSKTPENSFPMSSSVCKSLGNAVKSIFPVRQLSDKTQICKPSGKLVQSIVPFRKFTRRLRSLSCLGKRFASSVPWSACALMWTTWRVLGSHSSLIRPGRWSPFLKSIPMRTFGELQCIR